jgi:hypothetical protein
VKPAQLIPCSLVFAFSGFAATAFGQAGPAPDAEPAAAAPAPPPAPLAPAAQPAPPDLPPPPPPRGAPPPPQGKLVISTPPVPPAVARAGYHVHDGFYLRIAAGFGGGHGSVSTDRNSVPNFGVGGVGLAFNVWVGGTPWRGIALGGMLSAQGMRDADTVVEGQKTGLGMQGTSYLIAPFIDVFPDPMRGLHVGGALGLAGFNATANSHALELDHDVTDYRGGGLGGSAWIGYGGWVGPEWSLGGLLQLSGFATGQKEDDVNRNASGYALSLSFTALFH